MDLLHRFRKDTTNGLVSGICAGIARGLQVERKWVRIVMLLLLLVATLPTAIIYIVAAVMLPPKSRWLD